MKISSSVNYSCLFVCCVMNIWDLMHEQSCRWKLSRSSLQFSSTFFLFSSITFHLSSLSSPFVQSSMTAYMRQLFCEKFLTLLENILVLKVKLMFCFCVFKNYLPSFFRFIVQVTVTKKVQIFSQVSFSIKCFLKKGFHRK